MNRTVLKTFDTSVFSVYRPGHFALQVDFLVTAQDYIALILPPV